MIMVTHCRKLYTSADFGRILYKGENFKTQTKGENHFFKPALLEKVSFPKNSLPFIQQRIPDNRKYQFCFMFPCWIPYRKIVLRTPMFSFVVTRAMKMIININSEQEGNMGTKTGTKASYCHRA